MWHDKEEISIPAHTHITCPTFLRPAPLDTLELTLKFDFAAGIHLRLEANAGEHGKEAALEVLREAEVEFPDDDARHVGDPKDCVRHVRRLFSFRFPEDSTYQSFCAGVHVATRLMQN